MEINKILKYREDMYHKLNNMAKTHYNPHQEIIIPIQIEQLVNDNFNSLPEITKQFELNHICQKITDNNEFYCYITDNLKMLLIHPKSLQDIEAEKEYISTTLSNILLDLTGNQIQEFYKLCKIVEFKSLYETITFYHNQQIDKLINDINYLDYEPDMGFILNGIPINREYLDIKFSISKNQIVFNIIQKEKQVNHI